MSDSKDTGEKQWPEVTIYANGQIQGRPDFRPVAANNPPEERYVPVHSIRERLTSDEVIEKAAATFQFGRVFEGDRLLARAAIEAALLATFPAEEEQDRGGQ